MDVNVERIRERLVFIRQQVGVLAPLARNQELRHRRFQDQLSYGGIVQSLQTSIEA